MDVAARLEAVEIQNDILRERIALLEEQLGMRLPAPIEFQLTGRESALFGALMKRDMATKGALMMAIYSLESGEEPEVKIVDVFVCKIRRKLKPYGVSIDTVWGQGYRMSPASKAIVHDMMNANVAPIPAPAPL